MRFGRWALLAGVVSLLAPAPAPALEAFEGRIQLHGAISEDLRVLSNGYRVRDHNWFMSKMATKLSLEFEFELFPDGIGPLDIVEAFARVDVQYDCIYNHACHMAPQWKPEASYAFFSRFLEKKDLRTGATIAPAREETIVV